MFEIRMYAEGFGLSLSVAIDLVMAALCKEHGWDAHVTAAQLRRKRLLAHPSEIAEELKYVPFEVVKPHLEPQPDDWLEDFDKVEQFWVSDLTTIDFVPEDSFAAYGY